MVSDPIRLGPFDLIKCKNKLGVYDCVLQTSSGSDEHVGTVVSVESNGAKVLVNGKEIFIKAGMLDKTVCSVVSGSDGNTLQC